jgi:MFS family permease
VNLTDAAYRGDVNTDSDHAGVHAREPTDESPWSPLRVAIFRALWIASLASYLGTWMQLVGASWLMTTLTTSASLVALVQTAISFPAFVLALPAGALADVLDRRRMIIATQTWQLLAAATLGVITFTDSVTPASLLALTLALGAGSALGLPVFWAIFPELVGRPRLAAAISLNSVALTLAQALGPAVGGLLVASAGAEAVFFFNALSFLGVVAVVARWRRVPPASAMPAEHVLGAVRAGVRYLLNARRLQIVLLRVLSHALAFSALPALLVVVVEERLGAGAGAYGALYGCLGAGGAIGGLLVPRLRPQLGTDRLVLLAFPAVATALIALATVRSAAALAPMMLVAGIGSMTIISLLNISVQSVLPGWVRGRGLALYLLTFQAGMASGAALWGALAASAGVVTSLLAAATGMVAVHLLGWSAGLRLAVADRVDLTPAPWSEPGFALEPEPGEGPIRIEIEYRIAEEDRAEFLAAMRELRRVRRRDGAMRWSLSRDLSDPERHLETFLVGSWAEHERAHERAIRADRAAIERVLTLHRGDPPRVTHLLAEQER